MSSGDWIAIVSVVVTGIGVIVALAGVRDPLTGGLIACPRRLNTDVLRPARAVSVVSLPASPLIPKQHGPVAVGCPGPERWSPIGAGEGVR